MQDVHHPRLYQVAEQEFQKNELEALFASWFQNINYRQPLFFCTNKMLQASSYY